MIPVESFGGGLVDVSAVDTGPRACSIPRCLGGGPASPCYAYPLQALVLGPGGHGSTPVPAHSRPQGRPREPVAGSGAEGPDLVGVS